MLMGIKTSVNMLYVCHEMLHYLRGDLRHSTVIKVHVRLFEKQYRMKFHSCACNIVSQFHLFCIPVYY